MEYAGLLLIIASVLGVMWLEDRREGDEHAAMMVLEAGPGASSVRCLRAAARHGRRMERRRRWALRMRRIFAREVR